MAYFTESLWRIRDVDVPTKGDSIGSPLREHHPGIAASELIARGISELAQSIRDWASSLNAFVLHALSLSALRADTRAFRKETGPRYAKH